MLKRNKNIIVKFIAVVLTVIFLHYSYILKPIESVLSKVLNPVFGKAYDLSSSIRSSYAKKVSSMNVYDENRRLKYEVVRLTEDNAKYRIIEEENNELRKHLNFLSKNEYKYLLSNVISRGSVSDSLGMIETITIDKGFNDGLFVGLGVVGSQGTLVGKIVEVKANVSKVYLSNNSRCKLAATILGQSKTSGITEGEMGLTIKMGYIPQTKNIKKDDLVVSSGLETNIPRGLVIGKVDEVSHDNNELWKTAKLSSLFDAEDLIIVSVILP